MSKNVSELCTLLIGEMYGALPCKVAHTLLNQGRLHLLDIRSYSGLSQLEIKSALAVLVQQNLLFHCTVPSQAGPVTHYEANVAQIYNLARLGKGVNLIEQRLGANAGKIVSVLQRLGNAKFNDVSEIVQVSPHLPKQQKQAAKEDNPIPNNPTEFSGPFKALVDHGLIEPLRDPKQLMSLPDFRDAADRSLAAAGEMLKSTGSKAKAEHDLKMITRMRNWRIQYTAPHVVKNDLGDEGSADEDRPSKRRRLNSDTGPRVNGVRSRHVIGSDDEDEEPVFDDVPFRIAIEKFNVLSRSDQLVQLAARSLGDPTAKAYRALLECVEDRIHRCFDPFLTGSELEETLLSPPVTTDCVSNALTASTDLSSTVAPICDDSSYPQPNGAQINRQRHFQVEQHLRLLAEHQHGFATFFESPDPEVPGVWRVDFKRVVCSLIQESIEDYISAVFGPHAKRLTRILHTQGKLDEKRLMHVALLRQRELRVALASLQGAGLLDVQEVPKDAARLPSKTIFLWFYDQNRARLALLENTYKGMARLLQRIKFEREKSRPFLEKAERTDVQGHEDTLLAPQDREQLRGWLRREERLLVQLGRQDELVALLRDFVPLIMK